MSTDIASRAAELVERHAARLGMDSMAAGVLARAIRALHEPTPFEQARRALIAHRWSPQEADQLAQLIRFSDLPEAQRRMLIASAPDDVTGEEGLGVELRTGADYAVAKALERRGLGHREGPGGSLPGMYWSNAEGLALRQILMEREA